MTLVYSINSSNENSAFILSSGVNTSPKFAQAIDILSAVSDAGITNCVDDVWVCFAMLDTSFEQMNYIM